MYQVISNDKNFKLIEIPLDSSLLSSRDCFLLKSPSHLYTWYGTLSANKIKSKTCEISELFDRSKLLFSEISEGNEPDQFWELLGTRKPYLDNSFWEKYNKSPQLFMCSNNTGKFTVTPISKFRKNDLNCSEIYFLNNHHEIYLWIGSQSSPIQLLLTQNMLKNYVKHYSVIHSRKDELKIISIKEGEDQEPSDFKRHFTGWL